MIRPGNWYELPENVQHAILELFGGGVTDGAHHKQYAISRALMFLMGEHWGKWLEEYNSQSDYSNWDVTGYDS